MKFEGVRNSLETLLLNGSTAGDYRVIGYQKTAEDAENGIGDKRFVTCYYSNGDFPKSSGVEAGGPIDHDMSFQVELTVTQPAKGDASSLTSASTAAQRLSALTGFKDACRLADRELDDFYSVIWNLIMDSRNRDLGYSENLGSRWIGSFQKGEPIDMQKFVTISGVLSLTAMIDEIPAGDPGLTGEDVAVNFGINEDPVQATGLKFDISGNPVS